MGAVNIVIRDLNDHTIATWTEADERIPAWVSNAGNVFHHQGTITPSGDAIYRPARGNRGNRGEINSAPRYRRDFHHD